MRTSQDLPDFEKPPVIEVVCGIQFKELRSLLAPHLGLLWEKFKAEYPGCQEVPPLAGTFERFDEGASSKADIQLSENPPLPRIWFIHTQGNGIVQVQRNRFLHNWKKIRIEDEYPRYGAVISMFRERLATFEDFVEENALGTIEPLQYEMTYMNHIPQGEGWDSMGELGTIFPDFTWRNEKDRFLPQTESISWRTSFALPKRTGRLHVTIRNVQRREDNLPLLLYELTVRGMPADTSRDAMWKWFDLAREWIVRGFEDLTGTDIQTKTWRKKQ